MRLKLVILLSSFTFLLALYLWINSSKLQNDQNIVVVSFCSLKKDLLESFTKDRNLSQDLYIDKLAKKSIILKDMVSYDGWRGLSRHLKQIPIETLTQKNYQIIGASKDNKLEDVSDSTLRLLRFDNKELYFQKINSEVKESSQMGKPFFISMHLEWSHFPFNDSVDENLDTYLKTTIKNGNDFNNRLPFLSALIPHSILRNRFPQKYPKLLKENELAYAWKIIKDPQNIARWKRSPYFHSDILLLKKYYIARIKVLDHDLEDFLHPLENSSHIVFVSCHGQPFLENNDFLHGNPFDENTGQLPAFVHIAGQNNSGSFEEQTGMQKLGAVVAQLTMLERNPSSWFAKLSKDLSEPQIIQYDCAGENMAIRDQGEFKYIYNFATGEEELFQIDKENQKLVELDQNNFKQAIIKYKETIMSKASEILNLSQKMKNDGYCFYNYAYSSHGK